MSDDSMMDRIEIAIDSMAMGIEPLPERLRTAVEYTLLPIRIESVPENVRQRFQQIIDSAGKTLPTDEAHELTRLLIDIADELRAARL